VRGDLCAHDPGAKDGGTLDGQYFTVLSMAARMSLG
jgi:hypothetical protein